MIDKSGIIEFQENVLNNFKGVISFTNDIFKLNCEMDGIKSFNLEISISKKNNKEK